MLKMHQASSLMQEGWNAVNHITYLGRRMGDMFFEFRRQANELLFVTWSKAWNGGKVARRRFLSIYSEAKDETSDTKS